MTCTHITQSQYQEYECGLTGASVSADCGFPSEDDLAGECIPRQALRYLNGDRAKFASLGRAEREAVMGAAKKIADRRNASPAREETKMLQVTGGGDFSSMSAEQLEKLAAAAKAEAKKKKLAEKRQARIVPLLREERDRLIKRSREIDEALLAIRDGKPIDLKALGIKAKGVHSAGPRKPLTPAQQAHMKRMREAKQKKQGKS